MPLEKSTCLIPEHYPQTATLLQQGLTNRPQFPAPHSADWAPTATSTAGGPLYALNGPLLGQSRNPSRALSLCVKLRGVQLLRRQLAPFDIHVFVFLMDGALFNMSDPPPLS